MTSFIKVFSFGLYESSSLSTQWGLDCWTVDWSNAHLALFLYTLSIAEKVIEFINDVLVCSNVWVVTLFGNYCFPFNVKSCIILLICDIVCRQVFL